MIDKQFSGLPLSLRVKHAFPTRDDLRPLRPPVQVITSRDDKTVPLHFGQALRCVLEGHGAFLEISGSSKRKHFPSRIR